MKALKSLGSATGQPVQLRASTRGGLFECVGGRGVLRHGLLPCDAFSVRVTESLHNGLGERLLGMIRVRRRSRVTV